MIQGSLIEVGIVKELPARKCKTCGGAFVPDRSSQVRCSKRCRDAAARAGRAKKVKAAMRLWRERGGKK